MKNQLLQNLLFGNLVCGTTYKNLQVQISQSKSSSILQKLLTANSAISNYSIFLLERAPLLHDKLKFCKAAGHSKGKSTEFLVLTGNFNNTSFGEMRLVLVSRLEEGRVDGVVFFFFFFFL